MSGWWVGKVKMIILSFWVGTSKNKNIDHRVKKPCAIMSTHVTCETDHISLCALNFCFYVFHYNLKE